MTLDRIDPDGDYEPGNCRWADASTQSYNQRKRAGTTSQYIGVHRIKSTGKWAAMVCINGKNKNLGHFDIEEDAARVRDAKLIELGIAAQMNFKQERVA